MEDTAFDDWKSVVLKLSRNEPELLLLLIRTVIEKMETINCQTGDYQSSLDYANTRRFELLSHFFEWLVENLRTQNPKSSKCSKMEKLLSMATVLGLLRRCLLVSKPGNEPLMASAITLAQVVGGTFLIHKLKKFALLNQPSLSEEYSFNDALLSQQEYSIHLAQEKLELVKRAR